MFRIDNLGAFLETRFCTGASLRRLLPQEGV